MSINVVFSECRQLRMRLLFVALLACAHAQAQDGIELEAPDGIAPLLRQHLSVLSAEHARAVSDETDRIALVRRARHEVGDLLATEGYFSPRVTLESRERGWVLVVAPGARSTVSAVSLSLREGNPMSSAESAAWLERMNAAWPLKKGEPFRQSLWDAGKVKLVEEMSRRVYAAARVSASRAEVDPEHASVVLSAEVDPGPKFFLGALQVEGLEDYDADLVTRYRPPKQGQPFDEDRLLAFQTELQNTPYFASALVDIDRDPATAEATPVRVLVSESKPRRVSVGAGFSTNSGYRAEAGYRDANLLGRAWQLSTGLRVEQRDLLAFADVFLPPSRHGFQDSFGVLHERSDHEGLKVSREAFGVTRSFRIPRGELGVSIKYQRERTDPDGAEPSKQAALTGDLTLQWRQVNDLLDPRSGFVAYGRLGGAGKALLSDQNFLRAYGRVQAYFPIGERDVLSLRGEFGKTFATSREGIPQDFLFRAGGSQSVRGYGYRSLGVVQGDAVVGGRYLATASAEYTRWQPAGWGIAGFVDAGNAADDPNDLRLLLGYGLGARWKSPAGPLALDIAYGQDERRLRLHFSIQIAY